MVKLIRGVNMELLDIYDEDLNHLGVENRNTVHEKALWHKTVHCWLYDNKGNVYFQIRTDEGTLYTTSSGHILAGESVKEAFGREIFEELGYEIDYENAELIDVVKFKMDKVKKDGSLFRDRAFANVYACILDDDISKFNFDIEEVLGLVRINAKNTYDLFLNRIDEISGDKIIKRDNKVKVEHSSFKVSDFLVNEGEDALTKYGDVLKFIISKGEENEKD